MFLSQGASGRELAKIGDELMLSQKVNSYYYAKLIMEKSEMIRFLNYFHELDIVCFETQLSPS